MLRFLLAAMVTLSIITACGRDDGKVNDPKPTATDTPVKNDMDKAGDDLKDGAGDAVKGAGDAVKDIGEGAGDAVKGAGNAVKDAGNSMKDMK